MNPLSLRILPLLLATVLILESCGGGGGTQTASGGIGGTGVSYGTITDFGSVWVNGVEYSTAGTTIVVDGIAGTQNSLQIGMVATVRGAIAGATGTAMSIVVEDAVEGYVEQTGTNTLVVLGQTVVVDDTTRFDSSVPNFAAIQIGDLLEVNGHVKADGVISAAYVQKKTAPADFQVHGYVRNHDPGARTFVVGGLTVNYAGAATGDMPSAPWNQVLVDVKGFSCGSTPVCGTLAATSVEPQGLGVADADEAEVEGFVTEVLAPNAFVVGNQLVITTASTVFEGGLPTDVGLGVKLEVEGTLAGGVLTAEQVEFRDAIELESDVATVNSSTLTLAGLAPITVTVDSLTQFKGSLASSLAQIAPGDHVKVRGRLVASTTSTVIATQLEETSTDTEVELQGPVSGTPTDPNVTILDVVVNTTGIPDPNFTDVNDNPIGRAAFFATVRPGDLVKAGGTLSGSLVTWSEMELED
jgi:hypothetical protein